jgi:hypothetical protein
MVLKQKPIKMKNTVTKAEAEEDYMTTPISVLRYISELEEYAKQSKQEEEKPQPQEKVEMKRPNRKDYINRHTPIKLIADLERYIDHLENTLQDNGLLTVKQAESICIGFYNDLVGHLESGLSTELFFVEIVFNKHLEKALK